MDDLIQELKENGYIELDDWLVADGELWVSPMTCLWIIESNWSDVDLISVWEPNDKEGPFVKPSVLQGNDLTSPRTMMTPSGERSRIMENAFDEWRTAYEVLEAAGRKIDNEIGPTIHVIRSTRDITAMRQLIIAIPDTVRKAFLIDILQNEMGCQCRVDTLPCKCTNTFISDVLGPITDPNIPGFG